MERLPKPAEVILKPTEALYRAIMMARNHGFDAGILKAEEVGRPVVSIGNLTAGGTGKTPFTAWLVKGLLDRGRKIGIVSRGYGGEERGPAHVPATEPSLDNAWRFGDEPVWMASRFPEVPVVVGADRAKAAKHLIEVQVASGHNVDLIVADDAFQHRWIKRDYDIVLLDATEPRWHYRGLPLGRMRESFESLERAHAVVITKSNLADPEASEWLRARVEGKVPLVLEIESVIPGWTALGLENSPSEPANIFRGRRVLLVSGIGRPQAFSDLTRVASGAEVVDHMVFKDHHSFIERDFRAIESRAASLRAEAVLVTEKDAVKMDAWKSTPVPVYVSRLEFREKSGQENRKKELHEAIDRLLL